jgi:hypothetical protein
VVEHLDELRSRLIVCAAVFGAAWALAGWQNHLVLEIVNAPLPDGKPITLALNLAYPGVDNEWSDESASRRRRFVQAQRRRWAA